MTWDGVLKSAFEIGLKPDEFWDLTWREYSLMLETYEKKEEAKWLHTREIIAMIYNTNISKKTQAKSGRQIIPLPSEKPIKSKRNSTPKQIEEACRRFGIPFNPIIN